MPEDRSSKQPPAGDDRNLVVVDEDFVNADTEDRLWLFWERNKDVIVKATFAVVVGILAFLAYFFWNESRREALGEEFTACQDEAARRAFAQSHQGEPLAAVAMTDVADDLKKAGKFADAAKAYDEANRLAGLAGKAPAVAAAPARPDSNPAASSCIRRIPIPPGSCPASRTRSAIRWTAGWW